jgi:hypothetical protein
MDGIEVVVGGGKAEIEIGVGIDLGTGEVKTSRTVLPISQGGTEIETENVIETEIEIGTEEKVVREPDPETEMEAERGRR